MNSKYKCIDVTLTFSQPVYEVLEMAVKFMNETLEDYIAEVVRRDILTIRDGCYEDWADWVEDKLKDESWHWKNQTPEARKLIQQNKEEIQRERELEELANGQT